MQTLFRSNRISPSFISSTARSIDVFLRRLGTKTVMQNQILEAIRSYVEKYNAEKKYSMVIATQSVNGTPGSLTAPVLEAESFLDITEEILAGLNDEYIKSKSAPKSSTTE